MAWERKPEHQVKQVGSASFSKSCSYFKRLPLAWIEHGPLQLRNIAHMKYFSTYFNFKATSTEQEGLRSSLRQPFWEDMYDLLLCDSMA